MDSPILNVLKETGCRALSGDTSPFAITVIVIVDVAITRLATA
jgi:hypothetical protein